MIQLIKKNDLLNIFLLGVEEYLQQVAADQGRGQGPQGQQHQDYNLVLQLALQLQ